MQIAMNSRVKVDSLRVHELADFYADTFKTWKKKKPNSAGGFSAIICGVDSLGAHIYVFGNESVNDFPACFDAQGFACIGGGDQIAQGQLKEHRHNPAIHYQETLVTVHQAKKKAEMADGVGGGTDMFLITPKGVIPFPSSFIHALDEKYSKRQEADHRLIFNDRLAVVLGMSSFFEVGKSAPFQNQPETRLPPYPKRESLE
jgi:20S proteasome alpha/beta subunit